MSFWDNVKKFAQPYSDDDYEDEDYDDGMDEYEEETVKEAAPRTRRPNPFAAAQAAEAPEAPAAAAAAPASGFSGQVLNMSSGTKQEVVLVHAQTFEDAAKAADELRRKRAVILNMENVDKALTRRVVDFLSGAVYAMDGHVKKVAQATYLFCPHNMDVVGDLENIQSEVQSYL